MEVIVTLVKSLVQQSIAAILSRTRATPAPIVIKLKKLHDHHAGVVLPRASHLSTVTLEDETSSPSTLRVKLKNPFVNGNVDQNSEECTNLVSSENRTRPVKRIRKSSPNDIIPSIVEADTNRQLSVKLKKPDNDPLISNANQKTSPMSTEYLVNEQQNCATTNGHSEPLYKPLTIQSSTAPDITNMLSNFNHDRNLTDPTTTTNTITTTTSTVPSAVETHTKGLLDEALDSVKNVLMQTFKKNLEAGGDLNALKSTLGSDEVAEVFLAKLRQSLKRDSENELKSQESHVDTAIHISPIPTPSSSSNVMISPVMNVASSPSSSPSLPPMSTMINRTTSPSIAIPSSPQSQATISNNNKRKSSTPSTNPNRFDGTTEEELAKRVLSDILQPNLDIVFVGINPSLYAVHKGHHYGGPGNHFWKLLHISGLIPSAFNATDDYRMPQYGIGFTNIVQRPSKAGSDITKDEITAGAEVLMQKIKMYRPKIVAFNGRGIYEVYAGNKHFHYGKQPELFLGTDTHVFVMPSSSARCSQLPRAEDKLPFYVGLRKLRDFVNGTLPTLNEAEITFPDIKIKDTDDVLQKTVIRISNKPFSELSAETLKSYGDKIPSGQMISKHISSSQQIICSSPSPSSPSSSSSNLVFNTDALTTQTMSILHNTNPQQNGNLLTYDQQAQRVYLQSNGNYSSSPPPPPSSSVNQQQRPGTNGTIITSKNAFLDNSSSNTNAAVLAALASGAYSSSSSQSQQTYYQQSQTVYVGGQQQQQDSVPSSLNNSSNNKSYVIHHSPQLTRSADHQTSSLSQVLSRPLAVVNSSEPLPSFSTILSSSSSLLRAQQTLSKDSLSSHSSTGKTTLIVVPPKTKPISSSTNPSTIILSKTSNINATEKRPFHTTDDCSYVRYEREPLSINADQFCFSYVIDEHSPSPNKRLRYVSINDL